MGNTSCFHKSLLGGLLVGFLLIAVFTVLFVGVSRVKADIGTGCGNATGTATNFGDTSVVDTTKNWKPANRWKGGVLTLIDGTSGSSKTATSKSITASTNDSITVSGWTPAIDGFTAPTYRVTAKPNACRVGTGLDAKDFSCLQTGDIGYCKGPCSAYSDCKVFLVSGTLDAGFEGTKCSSADVLNPGVCLELPRSGSRLKDEALTTTGAGLLGLVDTVTNWVFAVFTVLAIIFILLAAFQFVTGGGDEAKISEARQKLIWATVGIIVALLAKGLVPVIRAIVGG